jgi:DNA-directed RNA polymerase specialized sigma subunit
VKNYYNSKLEFENKIDRIRILKHDIEKIDLKLTKITGTMKDVNTSGGEKEASKIHSYTVQKVSKQEEIKELEEEIEFLRPIIKRMEQRVNAMVGLEKEVFELFYGKNIKVKHIALMKNFSPQRIYQILDRVNEKLDIK